MTKLRRSVSIVIALSLYLVLPPAHAGIAAVISCSSCQTTTDFTNAALSRYWSDYGGQYYPTTYQVVSNSCPMTAYIAVSGGYIWLQEPTYGTWYQYWIPTAGYAVDGNGNSIAADSETAAENFYLALDEMQIGTNRAAPAYPAVPLGTSNLPYPPGSPLYSFPNSDDTAVGNEIDARWGVYTRMLQNGDLFSVKFADGTIAYYQLTDFLLPSGQEVRFWTWIKAFDKNGVQIGKDGKPVPNPNSDPQTAPGGGGIWQSTTDYAALGPSLDGNEYAWQLASAGACVSQQTISINGQVDSTGTFWVPCP